MKFLVIILLFVGSLHASEIVTAGKSKDYEKVVSLYMQDRKANFSVQELATVSLSLRQMENYSEDVIVSSKLLKKKFLKEHTALIAAIKSAESIDSDEYPKGQKIIYWNLLKDYAAIVKKHSSKSEKLDKDFKHFTLVSKYLGELEFRENEVDKITNDVNLHLKYLEDKIYHYKTSVSLQYVSWQQEGILKTPTGDTSLIITNSGACVGGDAGVENYRYHFYVDGCFLFGSGGVKNTEGTPYQQSNLPAFGVKFGPGVSMIVSYTRARVGIRLPFIYSVQNLTQPTDKTLTVEDTPQFSMLTSLYSRWLFDKWYIQTELGKYIKAEKTFWGLGVGYSF